MTHVYRQVFQEEYESHRYRNVEDHLEGPGVLQEQPTHGLRPEIAYFLKHACDTSLKASFSREIRILIYEK